MRIYVKVIPKASRSEVVLVSEGTYHIKTTAAPEQGKANDAVIALLAKHFRVAKSLVHIVGGKSARSKIIDIDKDV